MRIKKVKTISDGDRGLKVDYIKPYNMNNKDYNELNNPQWEHPITPELTESFNKLKIHLLRLCRLWDPQQERFINDAGSGLTVPEVLNETYKRMRSIFDDLVVTGVTSNLEDFLIIGKMKGEHTGNINFVTMNIRAEDDYPHYDKVIDIIDELYQNIGKYIEYKGVIDAKEVVAKEASSKREFFDNSMTDEEVKKEAEKIKERTGKVIPIGGESSDEELSEEREPAFQEEGFDTGNAMPFPAGQQEQM